MTAMAMMSATGLLRMIASVNGSRPRARRLVARLAGDEFAIALAVRKEELVEAEVLAEQLLREVTRPMEAEGLLVQVGAFSELRAADPDEGQIPDLLRRADIALDRAKSNAVGASDLVRRRAWSEH